MTKILTSTSTDKACLVSSLKKSLSALALFLFALASHAANYYWVGNTGNWSQFATHWATTSGGSTFHTSAPTQSDSVFFDANSFSAPADTVTVDVVADCGNMDWTGANSPVLAGASQINIYGSLTFATGMTASYTGGLYFDATTTGNTVNTNGVTFNGWGIYFQGTGDWTFMNALNAPTAWFYLNGGTVFANGKTLNFNGFNSFASNPRTFNLDTSTINAANWMISFPAGMTIVPGTSTINISGGNFTGGSKTYHNVNITSSFASVNINGSNTYNNLAVTGLINTINIQDASTQTFSSLALPSGTCVGLVTISAPNLATFSRASGTFTGNYLRIQNIQATGGATFNANNSIGTGTTSGWNITNPSGGNLFWIGGTGNWSDSSHWSLTSGGAPAFCLPNELTNALFDANSFPGFGSTVTINTTAYCKTMNWTGAGGFPTLAGAATLNIYKSMILIFGMGTTATGTLNFLSDSIGNIINTGGHALQHSGIYFDGNGTWTLNTNGLNGKLFYLNKGVFSTNNLGLTITGYYSMTSKVRGMSLGSSTVNCNGDWYITDTTTFAFNAGSSNITVTGTNFRGGGFTYNNVTLSNAGTVAIYSGNTFNSFTVQNATTTIFESGQTQTSSAYSFPNGTCAAYRTMQASLNGTQATISKASGTLTLSFYNIKDMKANGGATFNANNSFDNGNNTGWNFGATSGVNYYWVGGTGNWSNGATHWSLTSGGGGSGCVPTKLDNVFFDANSFTGAAKTVTVDVDAYCNSMDWTGINTANTRTLAGAVARNLYINGSLKFVAGTTNSFNGSVYFKSDTAGRTIDLAAKSLIGTTYFDGTGDWTLSSALTGTSLIHTKGTVKTNNQSVNISSYSATQPNVRQLQLGSSTITVSGSWNLSDSTNFTMSAGTSIINLNGTYFNGGGLAYYNLTINNAGAVSVYGGNTFNLLTISTTKDISFDGGKTQTVTALSMPNGTSCSNLVKIKTLAPGVPANLSMASGTYTGNFLQITDVTAGGGATFNASNSYGIGNTTGWNITSPSSQDFYWIAGTGNWSDLLHWSLTSGGAPAACVPSILDNVFFDANSFSGTDTVTVNVAASCNNMTWTGAAFNPNFAGFQPLNINGSLSFISAMNLTYGGAMSFTSSVAGNTIDFAGKQINIQLSFNGSGAWTLASPLTTSSSFQINYNSGTLTTNGNNISMGFGSFTSNSSATRTLNLGSSVVTTNSWNIQNPAGMTLNSGTSQISIPGFGFQFRGGGLNYNVVNLGSSTMQVLNSNTFDTLNITPGINVMFEDSNTQTINVLVASGMSGSNTQFNSVTVGAQATINVTGGKFCGDYMTIKDNKGLGGPLYAGANSVNNGNNSGWNFSPCPTVLTATATGTNVSCNGANDGTATANPSAGTSPYTFLWSNSATSATLSGLSPGTYTVTITDAVAATDTASVTITQPTTLTATATATAASCNGGNNGSATPTASGGTSPYSYLWSNGQSAATATGLTAGTYTVTVTDANGCTKTTTATVNQPTSISLTTSKTDASCNGSNNGTATVSASGGTTGYTYLWSDAQTTATATGLAAATYTVTVTDANSCTKTASVTVGEPAAMSLTTSKTDVNCNGASTGSASVAASGGASPYSYLWSSGATSATLSGLGAGTYTVTVTDANSCTKTASVTISQPSAIALTTSKTDVSCNGGNDGSATLTASGGASPYSYLWSNSKTTATTTGLIAGTYFVTVTDTNSCTATDSAVVNQSAAITLTTSVTDVNCNGGNNGKITLTVAGGASPYSYLWSDGKTTKNNFGSPAGTYTVTVTDANGCADSTSATISEPPALVANATATNASCNGGNNGSATLTASGGTTAYSYLWSDGQTTSTATGLAAGTYTVTVTDGNGCTITATATVSQPAAILLTTSATGASCNGGSNGTATVSASGGASGYTYLWNDGQTTATASGLAAGAYTVTVTDANSCTNSASATVNQPAAISLTTSATDATCNGASTGSATVSASGGASPYSYLWSNGETAATDTALAAGNYSVTVTDSGGCTATASATVNQPAAISITFTVTDAACGNSNGSATANPSGGATPYSYLWDDSQTTQVATGLAAGVYFVTVTDFTGCTATKPASVNNIGGPAASISAQTNVSCNGGNNGSATVSASGGATPYSFLWSNGSTTLTASGLTAATYSVTVTDNNNCKGVTTVTITQPASMSISFTTTNVTCNGASTGSATVSASGGTSPYSYLWSNGSTTLTASGLTAATYNVTATDANGCTQTSSVTVNQPTVLTATATATAVFCNGGNNGTATVSASGGTTGYTYLWSNGQTGATATGLTAATYSVTVTDANSCTKTASATVTEPAGIILTTSKTDVSCNGGNNGTATVNASGGATPYSYLWNNSQSTATATGLTAATYSVTVTDANGCSKTASATVNQPSALTATATATDASCNGASTGSASVSASGGTSPYSYLWSNGSTTLTASGLAAGTYSVTVTDANGCTKTASATVNEPTAVSLTTSESYVNCNGGNNGSATVTATGGTTPYSYSWSDGQTTSTATGLSAATYNVTVTDANGCTKTANATVSQPTTLTATATATAATCNGASTGSATVFASGGATPYSYLWSNGSTTFTASGLTAGTYTVTVTDANGCTATSSATVTQPTALSVAMISTNASCGNADGSAAAAVTGGTTPYSYLWSNGQTTASASGLAAGTYTVTVTDANGCTKTKSVAVNNNGGPSLTVSSAAVSCNGGGNGSATANASGGATPYSYTWSDGSTTLTASGLTAGTYTVTVTDANNCIVSGSAAVSEPAALTATATATAASCNGACNGTATANGTGGTSPYSYVWSDGSNSSTATGLCAGTVNVTVTDNNGCTANTSATISEPSAVAASATATAASCNGASTGSATVSASGGTSPYTYLWSNGSTSASLSGLAAGNYSVTATDANGCSATASATVTQPTAITLTMGSAAASCGNSDGAAFVSASGGTTAYSYLWSDGQTSSIAAGLPAGIYSVTVTDANGCTASASTVVNNTGGPTVTATSTNVSCNGGNDGTATASATGGTTPYSYLWNDSAATAAATATNLTAGNYIVLVTDNAGCVGSATVTISQPTALTMTLSKTDINCNGVCNGSANVSVSGGVTPFNYNWGNGAVVATTTGLCAGTYSVTVTDSNGCTKVDSVTISEPSAIVLSTSSTNVSCGGNNGSATLTASGGISPYSYLWSDGTTSATLSGLSAGTYSVTVTDANGCTATATVTVNNTGGVGVTTSATLVTCNGGNDGSATATTTGGNTGYTFLWSNGQTTMTATGLVAGTYIVTVTDINSGCSVVDSATVSEPTAIVCSVTSVPENTGCDGSLSVTATGGTSPYTYLWSDGQTTPTATGMCAGTHSVTITDSNGCTSVCNGTVQPSSTFNCAASSQNISCNGLCDGTATATVSGGVTPYAYSWVNAQSGVTATALCAGAYGVTITDANANTCTASATVIEPAVITLSLSATPDSGNTDGTATVVASGGTSPYNYLWTGGQTTATATGLANGMYSVTVTDANGCTAVDTVQVPLFIGINSPITDYWLPITIFPNPVKENLNVVVTLNKSETVKISLLNELGQEIIYPKQAMVKGKNIFSINTSQIANGVYYLKLISGGEKPQHLKFVKME